jgi:hypothetical protein
LRYGNPSIVHQGVPEAHSGGNSPHFCGILGEFANHRRPRNLRLYFASGTIKKLNGSSGVLYLPTDEDAASRNEHFSNRTNRSV